MPCNRPTVHTCYQPDQAKENEPLSRETFANSISRVQSTACSFRVDPRFGGAACLHLQGWKVSGEWKQKLHGSRQKDETSYCCRLLPGSLSQGIGGGGKGNWYGQGSRGGWFVLSSSVSSLSVCACANPFRVLSFHAGITFPSWRRWQKIAPKRR
jgi:hypothetical protein